MLHIQVVGTGCPTCQKLTALCEQAVEEAGVQARIEKVTDVSRFADLGVLLTPGLLVDGKLLSSGKLPSYHTLLRWFREAAEIDSSPQGA